LACISLKRSADVAAGSSPRIVVGAGATIYPLDVDGALKSMIEAEPLPPLDAVEVLDP
jgi:hypothetical protein